MNNPKWFNDMMERYKMGVNNFFVVRGNIEDYILPGQKLDNFLEKSFGNMNYNTSFVAPNKSFISRGAPFDQYGDELASMGNALSSKEKHVVIVKHAELIAPLSDRLSDQKQLDIINLYESLKEPEFINSSNILIMVTDDYSAINKKITSPALRSHIVEIPYPQEDERFEFIEFLDKTADKKIKKEISNIDFAKLTAGLTLSGIEDIYLIAESYGVLRKSYVKDRKNELIRAEYGDIIEIFDTDDYNFKMFAGQDHLKDYHKEVIVGPMIRGELDIVPKGLLYTGPPGTGKTHFAKCLSGEAGINFVEFKISKILDRWVGTSERNFEKALNCFKSITPVGVFIDEIDQSFSRGNNDSNGVRGAIFGMFLSALSDQSTRGKIIWIAATNYPNKLDEAMKRTGRFDKKMPFLPPEYEDRMETFKIHIGRFSDLDALSKEDYSMLAKRTEGYTQAEIEGIVLKSIELMKRKKQNSLSIHEIEEAMNYIVKAKSDNINEMIDISIDECNDLEFLPKKYWDRKK